MLRTFKVLPDDEESGGLSYVTSVAYSPDGKHVLTGSYQAVKIWDANSGDLVRSLDLPEEVAVFTSVYSRDGEQILTGDSDDLARLWRVRGGQELRSYVGHTAMVLAATFSPDEHWVLTGSGDQTARLWEAGTGRAVASLIGFEGTWEVVAPDLRFDAGNLDEIVGLHWVFPDDPYRPLRPEIFARDFFEPSLLPRLLTRERSPEPARPLAGLNRVQPEVADPMVRADGDVAQITLRVRATRNRDEFGQGDRRRKMASDAYDLRLMREGQLVWQFPSSDRDPNQDLTIRTDAQLKSWRHDYRIEPNRPDGWYEATVPVPLPHNRGAGEPIRFEAYCFNEDRVKSRTAAASVPTPAGMQRVKPKAYVICLGANASQTRALDLRYAAADAREIGRRLGDSLAARGYALVPVTLLSDYEGDRYKGRVVAEGATRGNIRSALAQLAGAELPPETRDRLPADARNLRQSGPDDLVIIYAATHGYTDPADGMFYLLPYDVGRHHLVGDAKTDSPAFRAILRNSVSSAELSKWLRAVDAAQHVLILDTCMSQGAVASAGSEFKPGPFGSRGLGQLAYDKAMLVLAASQTDEAAVGLPGLRHGLLTYTLLEGIASAGPGKPPRAADQDTGRLTLSGLLRYARDQAPDVYRAAKSGELEKRGVGVAAEPWAASSHEELEQRWPTLAGGGGAGAPQPVLFDYRRGRPDVDLTGATPAARVINRSDVPKRTEVRP
jgi:uncharacterized caspase-like protein